MRKTKVQDWEHLAVLNKFIYRLSSEMPAEDKARLEALISIYTRLYVRG